MLGSAQQPDSKSSYHSRQNRHYASYAPHACRAAKGYGDKVSPLLVAHLGGSEHYATLRL